MNNRVEKEEPQGRNPLDPLRGIDNLNWLDGLYQGTEEDIVKLRQLKDTEEFLTAYPDHDVFAVGSEIIGALPRHKEFSSPEYKETFEVLQKRMTEIGVTPDNCAFIMTGPNPLRLTQPRL